MHFSILHANFVIRQLNSRWNDVALNIHHLVCCVSFDGELEANELARKNERERGTECQLTAV